MAAAADPTPTRQRSCPSCGALYPADYAVCPRDATPLARGDAPADPLIGTILGETYEVQRRLGEGGMGRVYEARHVRLGRHYAVKIMHQMFAADRDALARFRREATAASTIHSANVAQVFDVNATRDGQPYLVYEYIDGEDLGTLLEREGSLSIARAAHIARQVASGLAAAHAAGVVHRDLKPENVMLAKAANDKDGGDVAKLLDFGIAKVQQEDKLTRTGALLGTPAYMAPEQARGGSTIDHRCDIYALGAMIYRAVTGRPAFGGEDAGRTLTSVIWDEPARPKTLRKDLPDALELVIQRAMAKDPEQRFSSMAELDAALAPFDAVTGATTRLDSAPIATGAPRLAGDVGRAQTIVASGTTGQTMAPPPSGRIDSGSQARYARPRAVVFGLLAMAWCVIVAGSAISFVIMTLTHHVLGTVEQVLVVALALALTAPLAVLEVRKLVRGAWRNTATMLGRADTLARASLLSLAAYALIAAPGRFWGLLTHTPAPALTEIGAIAAAIVVGAVGLRRR
ncbi:MAG: serine/threonine protein kinase [Myxococcales bacterium]|nr:serine/threonine protein kinase [Myxococcales bacterium]